MDEKLNSKTKEYRAIGKERGYSEKSPAESFFIETYEKLSGTYRAKACDYMLHLLHAQELEQELADRYSEKLKERSDEALAERCVFCKRGKDEAKKLICGPDNYCICDECIQICSELLV